MSGDVRLTEAERDLLETSAALYGWATQDEAFEATRKAVESILAARLAAERERIAEAMGALGAHWSDCTFPDDACVCEVGLFDARKDAARIARGGTGE